MKLTVGDQAPEFAGLNQNGDQISSADFSGKKLVVYFYPKDNTPGCTAQACNLNDNLDVLQEKGYSIIGISADSEKSHKKFVDKFDLKFDLIADEDKTIIKAFGVWGPKKFMGKEYEGIHRTTFLIDERGKIENIISKVKTKDHTAQILS